MLFSRKENIKNCKVDVFGLEIHGWVEMSKNKYGKRTPWYPT